MQKIITDTMNLLSKFNQTTLGGKKNLLGFFKKWVLLFTHLFGILLYKE